jgi:aminobenzoyl-glutamate utilization protein B
LNQLTEEKKSAIKWIDENSEMISGFHQRIWKYAEPAFREYESVKAFADFHRKEGFNVVIGVAGLPTAYIATWGEGSPVISTYTEYDAVPGTSQDAINYRATANPYMAGHTDPHSALGVGSLIGATAAKEAMEKHSLSGTIKVFGTPAEKVCAKPWLASKGLFENLDALIGWHPRNKTTVMYETQWGSYWSLAFIFECNKPEEWISQTPDLQRQARCPGALDALCLMYTTTKYTKEAMLPNTGLWSINETALVAGQSTADNIPPKISVIAYAFRSGSLSQQEQIHKVLMNNAKNVANITGCQLRTRWISKTRTGLFNKCLADIAYQNLESIGPPRYSESDKAVARKIIQNLGYDDITEPYHEELTPPNEWEKYWRSMIPPTQQKFGSDDYVEFTWHCPTVWIQIYTPRIELPGIRTPQWAKVALGGIKGPIDKSINIAGKAISATMLDLFTNPEKLRDCQEEFKERTKIYKEEPLLKPDLIPPMDLPWPEYITTVRGREWHIPPMK